MDDHYRLDLSELKQTVNAPRRIKLASIPENKIEKVGFGLVRYQDEKNKTNLWQIDGDSIVAMYDEETKVAETWSVKSDRFNKAATIFYKDMPIKNVVFAEIGIADSEINTFKQVLPERLASNKELVTKMLESLDDRYRLMVVQSYPELVK